MQISRYFSDQLCSPVFTHNLLDFRLNSFKLINLMKLMTQTIVFLVYFNFSLKSLGGGERSINTILVVKWTHQTLIFKPYFDLMNYLSIDYFWKHESHPERCINSFRLKQSNFWINGSLVATNHWDWYT